MNKGESFYDTVKTFESFGIDALVIRSNENEYYKQLVDHIHVPTLFKCRGWNEGSSDSIFIGFVDDSTRIQFLKDEDCDCWRY